MKRNIMRTVFLITLFLGLAAVAPAQDLNWNYCSIDSVVGTWAYSYTGTLMLPTGAVPMAAVGRTTIDGAGNVLATQNSSTGGKVSQDTIKGTLTANPDCTGTMTVSIYDSSGNLLRTAVWATVLDDRGREMRAILTSLVLANGTIVPPVTTMTARRLFPGQM